MKVKLGDVIELNPSEKLPKGDRARKIAMDNLDPYAREISGFDFDEYKGGTKFRNEDILLARIAPCLENGKTAYVNILEKEEVAFGSTEYFVLRAKKELINPLYLYYLSVSSNFRTVAIKSMTGTSGRQRVQKEAILNYEFDLPSLEEQEKIASRIGYLDDKKTLNDKINANLTNQLNSMFDKMYYESSSRIELMNFVSEMKSGDWGKAKSTDNFIKPATIIRGTDFCNVANGQKSDAPIRYLKTATIQKKHLIANDVLIEISGGSPTQSTGRSLLITDKLLNRYNTPVLGTNFTRLFRCETEENAVLFHSYINFLYNKNVFFNYENGTTGIKNLDYKSILKINVNDVQKHSLFPKYFSMYHFYESMKQHLGDESTALTCLKEQLLRKFF